MSGEFGNVVKSCFDPELIERKCHVLYSQVFTENRSKHVTVTVGSSRKPSVHKQEPVELE